MSNLVNILSPVRPVSLLFFPSLLCVYLLAHLPRRRWVTEGKSSRGSWMHFLGFTPLFKVQLLHCAPHGEEQVSRRKADVWSPRRPLKAERWDNGLRNRRASLLLFLFFFVRYPSLTITAWRRRRTEEGGRKSRNKGKQDGTYFECFMEKQSDTK